MKPDYDQLLCKKPKKFDAVFAWHQDMAYWPPVSMTPRTETATFSLAVDPTTTQNGCIKYIPGSHKGKELRRHVPVAKLTGKRDEAHAIAIQVDEAAETIVQAEVTPVQSCVALRPSCSIVRCHAAT
jgi:phytanoyl-CoA hydroxylase